MKPLVTVMVPTYSQALFLPQTIESALAQDYPNLEIVVSDDCSTDDIGEAVSGYLNDPRVKYFRNERNIGRTANYRKALYERASGEWVVNLDGDDYFTDSNFLSAAMEHLDNREDVVLIAAGAEKKYPDGRKVRHLISDNNRVVDGFELFINWPKRNVYHLAAVYRRGLACELGFYRTDYYSSDWESILRLSLNGKALLLNRVAGVWRKGQYNVTNELDLEKYAHNARWIEPPYEYALSLGHDKNLLKMWRKEMLRNHFVGYININADLQRQGIITRGTARSNLLALARYTARHEKHLLHDPLFLGTFSLAMLFKPCLFDKAKIMAKSLLEYS